MRTDRKTLFGDDRAIEGLPIRLVVAVVVGVLVAGIITGTVTTTGQFEKTELDVYIIEPGHSLENPGTTTISTTAGANNVLEFVTLDENGGAVNHVSIIVTDGTALLDAGIRKSTRNSNRVQIDLDKAYLKKDQSMGTLEVEAAPPSDNYVDQNDNQDILVREGVATPTPAPTPAPLDPGLEYSYYEAPNFDSLSKLRPSNKVSEATALTIGQQLTFRDENYGATYTGKIEIPQNGMYTFYLTSDDGSRLWINNNRLISNGGLHDSATKTQTVSLTSGRHDIRIEYFNGPGDEELKLEYRRGTGPRQPVTADMLYHRD